MDVPARIGLTLIAALALTGDGSADQPMRYLAFQIFTGGSASSATQRALPPPPNDLRATVAGLRDRVGVEGSGDRRLGVVLGPLAFDNSDADVRSLIAEGFDAALATGVAVGFHIDDSMFWGRLKALDARENVEWLDWRGTLNTGRRLDWSSKPLKIAPQLCLNSPAVRQAVAQRAALIGSEIAKGVARLHAAHRDELYLGVIAGWETQIGRDFDTGKSLGYCALTNAGYSASRPPVDKDVALEKIVREFAGFWAGSLIAAGAPRDKVFSHIAYLSSAMYAVSERTNPTAVRGPYLETIDFTPPAVAFCDRCIPGISTYPQPGHLEQWQTELAAHGDPPWASCEGTAIDPSEAERSGNGMDMEAYLGNLFDHGAVLVNVFGWGVGDASNAFRKIAENDTALAAYRKFLEGGTLREAPISVPALPPADLASKVHQIQAQLPGWIQRHGPAAVKDDLAQLDAALREKRFDDATRAADALLKTLASP
jgi:hypothetical protein